MSIPNIKYYLYLMTGTWDLPDMYALSPWACSYWASGIHSYQANHLCLCINYYVLTVRIYMHIFMLEIYHL